MQMKLQSLKALAIIALLVAPLAGQKFYPDDPLTEEPAPSRVDYANYKSLSLIHEVFKNTFKDPGERHPGNGVIPAAGVNTLGEVMDGAWFVNRHGRARMTAEELMRGPGIPDPPAREAPWRVLTVKSYDVRPGLLIEDAHKKLYLLRFDPPGRLEMSTGAGMIGSRIFHALGYWVVPSDLVVFDRKQLVAAAEGEDINAVGKSRRLGEAAIDLFLAKVPRDAANRYRAVAISAPEKTRLIGPFQFHGARSDDPNDVVPHEHRRDLRGLRVISAWLANNGINPLETMDALVAENGVPYIRHYFMDFFTVLGSGLQQEKKAHEGSEPLFDFPTAAKNFARLGLFAPEWQRAVFPGSRAVGLFECAVFDPAQWQPSINAAALANHLPDDDYWAARQIVAFSDDDIRAIVKTAEYSDPGTAEWVAKCLMERRDKIGRHFLDQVLPLENFRVESGQLRFDDLAVLRDYSPAREYKLQWFEFRNSQNEMIPLEGQRSPQVPERANSAAVGSYYAARISGPESGKTLTVYLRKETGGFKAAGIDRDWPGKGPAQEPHSKAQLHNPYGDLSPRRKELFNTYVAEYGGRAGSIIAPEERFQMLTFSERTTFGAITHALSKTALADGAGRAMGSALDLVDGVERLAGQYYGRRSDEQFRLFVRLRANAKETLDKAREFKLSEENTVFHPGYPLSYRQSGGYPSLHISVSEDGLKADIDVDYRSSKLPDAVWNGRLTSANLDIRSKDNFRRHSDRWAGMVNWWEEMLSGLGHDEPPTDLLAREPPEAPTPLPPDRPSGTQGTEVYEAVQEFLTDWLVRGQYREALRWISGEATACVPVGDGGRKTLLPVEARRKLREIMKNISVFKLGQVNSLTQGVDAVTPWHKAFRLVKHPFEGDFALAAAPDSFAGGFNCESRPKAARDMALEQANQRYGNYYGAFFRLKLSNRRGGVLGLLWTKQLDRWRLLGWDMFEQ